MRAVADWWDAVELWVTQLAFPLQVVLAAVVVLPVCAGLAILVDRVSGVVETIYDALPRANRLGRAPEPLLDPVAGAPADLLPARTDEP
ncbi:hypothetical protein [Pseudonocardia sp. D17]|uniref:hypothetical protein n=1 Tax=Pseudonocardia sp. D17 TaxID=882661 RepID=UPI0030CC3F7D|nr:hypothetical protein PSD17_47410 [Pseudonocardia sp. D17]